MRFGLAFLYVLTAAACSGDRGDHQPADLAGFAPQPDLAQPVHAPGTCGIVGSTQKLSTLAGVHAYPHIAPVGLGYVVAWLTANPDNSTFRVDAVITDHTGAPLGPNIPLSTDPIAAFDAPTIAPDVGGTSIAWTRVGNSTSTTATDIVLTTIDSLGEKLDATGMPCEPDDATCGVTPVTSSGTAHAPYLERPFQAMRIETPTQGQLGLAFTDTRNYTCTTSTCDNDVFWKRIQSNGTELLFEKQLTNTASHVYAAPRLAFDGFDQALVYRDVTTGDSSDLYFLAIDNMGVASLAPANIGTSSGTNAEATPDIVWNGTDYAIVSATGTDATATIVYQRQSTTGASTLSARGITFGGASCEPAIAYDGAGYGVVYQVNCGQANSQLAFVRIDADGVRYALDGTSCGSSIDPACGRVLLPHIVETDAPNMPQIVFGDESEYAIVWMEGAQPASATDPLEVYIQRVSCQ